MDSCFDMPRELAECSHQEVRCDLSVQQPSGFASRIEFSAAAHFIYLSFYISCIVFAKLCMFLAFFFVATTEI